MGLDKHFHVLILFCLTMAGLQIGVLRCQTHAVESRTATAVRADVVTIPRTTELVLGRAGAKVRDEDDLRVIQTVRDRSGRVGRGIS